MPALPSSLSQMTFSLIALALVVTGLVLGKHLFVPLALGAILAFVLSPLFDWLVRKGLHSGAAIAFLIIASVASFAGASVIFTNQIASAVTTVGENQANILSKVRSILRSGATDSSIGKAKASLDRLQGRIETELAKQQSGSATADSTPSPAAAPGSTAKPLTSASSPLGVFGAMLNPLATGALMILFASFLLAGKSDLRDRLVRIAGVDNVSATSAALSDVGATLSQLFLAQLIVNLGFGAFVALALWMIGLPNALLWGLAAGVLRFVPYVGAAIGAIPPLLLAASVEPGWTTLLLTLCVFLVIEPIVGHIVEPLVVGKAVGVSPIGMLLSAAFWTMVWGPVGLLLSAPITACLLVLGQHIRSLHLFEIAFADEPPLPPDVRMYHRLLAGDEQELLAEIKEDMPLEDQLAWVDQAIVPGLRLAAADQAVGRLDSAQLERIQETSDAIESALTYARDTRRAEHTVVIGARGPADRALATILTGVLGAIAPTSDKLGVRALQDLAQSTSLSRTIVVATVGGADTGQLQAIARRAQTLIPGATLIQCNLADERGRRVGTVAGHSQIISIEVHSARALAERLGSLAGSQGAPIDAALAKLGDAAGASALAAASTS